MSGITYVWTDEGWLYLAVVMDLYSRMVVGSAISERMTSKPPRGLIVHSERGSQYCSHAYQKIFVTHGLVCSMSKRGDCFDNAAMESWNHSFKVEAMHGGEINNKDPCKKCGV